MAVSKAKKSAVEHLVAENLSHDMVIIGADSEDRKGGDIVLAPLESIVLKDPAWEEDEHLLNRVEAGVIRLYRSTTKPKPIPPMPTGIVDPRDANIVRQIVFAPLSYPAREDDKPLPISATEWINANPKHELRAGHPVNAAFLKDRYIKVLEVALKWLLAWGRDNAEDRKKIALLEKRMKEIDALR